MGNELRFDGKVAIITGAGNGLGRSHALLLASRGAKIVVNDLGGAHTGGGSSQKAADLVVDEIKAAGGDAVPNYSSVEDGEAIVKTAMDAYGRVDIVVNNAGILRDTSFHKMSQEDWDLIYKVHVLGSFRVSHAAWPIMREQGYGRVVMTASAAGIYGNFGQANYSMAKLGLLGLSNTLAIEGRKRNIHVNTIAPIAGSRMTETVLPKSLLEVLKPEYVSPLVAVLCHEDCEETGGLFEVGGGVFNKLRWERTEGKVFRTGRAVSIEDVEGAWKKIGDFSKTTHPDSIAASMQPVMENVEAGPSKGGNEFIDVDAALGYRFPEMENSYDERDLAMYALGVGAATDPANDSDLQLVYEMHSKGMKALPTYGVIPALRAIMTMGQQGKTAPGLNYGLDRVLHGEQYMELLRPLPRNAKLSHRASVKEIWDKGKNALVVTEIISYDADGNRLVKNNLTTLVRGGGGWGGERGPGADINVPPDREPDSVVAEKIPDNAALLYRLSGDWNPLHADPGFAKAFGFERPILHGLCTFGYAGRHVIAKFAPEGNPDYFKSIRVRFADSVFPGETLVTQMWKENDHKIVFVTKVKERDSVVLSGAGVEFFKEIPKPVAKAKKTETASAATPATFVSADIFNAIATYAADNPDVASKINTVFQFKLSAPDAVWTLDFKEGKFGVGELAAAQCTLEMGDADFMAMSTGKSDPMKLFSTGKLKISGDVMASQKLGFLKKLTPERIMAEVNKRTGSSGAASAAAIDDAAAVDMQPTSWDVFIAIRDHIERNPGLVDKVASVFLFKVTDPDKVWTLNMKSAPGSVDEGETATPDCTLQISEADLLDMTTGKSDPMKLFSTGKLNISGNVMASQKLAFLQKMDPKQAMEAVKKARAARRGPDSAASGSPAAPAPSQSAQAGAVFAALSKRLADNGGLAAEVGVAVRFVLTHPDAVWTVDFASQSPAAIEGDAGEVAATLTLTDAGLTALANGEASARDLFQRGKLRVDGDVTVAHRLGLLKGLL